MRVKLKAVLVINTQQSVFQNAGQSCFTKLLIIQRYLNLSPKSVCYHVIILYQPGWGNQTPCLPLRANFLQKPSVQQSAQLILNRSNYYLTCSPPFLFFSPGLSVCPVFLAVLCLSPPPFSTERKGPAEGGPLVLLQVLHLFIYV